tara:strand:- start:2693 stop:3097 length:405 start_codon:yes stop_codon:yes gene_type:complete
MSTVITDNLTGKTSAGDVTITSEGGSATMQLQQGVAKAWLNLTGEGTIAINDSLNISSADDNGTGNFDQNYTNNLGNQNYSASGCARDSSSGGFSILRFSVFNNTTGTRFVTNNSSGSSIDSHLVTDDIHGDLA